MSSYSLMKLLSLKKIISKMHHMKYQISNNNIKSKLLKPNENSKNNALVSRKSALYIKQNSEGQTFVSFVIKKVSLSMFHHSVTEIPSPACSLFKNARVDLFSKQKTFQTSITIN